MLNLSLRGKSNLVLHVGVWRHFHQTIAIGSFTWWLTMIAITIRSQFWYWSRKKANPITESRRSSAPIFIELYKLLVICKNMDYFLLMLIFMLSDNPKSAVILLSFLDKSDFSIQLTHKSIKCKNRLVFVCTEDKSLGGPCEVHFTATRPASCHLLVFFWCQSA